MNKHTPGAMRAAKRVVDFLGLPHREKRDADIAAIITEETAAEQIQLQADNAILKRTIAELREQLEKP